MPDLEQWPTGRLLTTAARLVEHAWNERLVDIGVTHAGVIALGVLADQGAMTQAGLAQIVRVQAQTMGKTLGRLESRGHVTRVRNDLDRRSHMVSISPAGRQVLDAADDIERTLVAGGGLVSEELRSHLQAIVRELGAPRWSPTSANSTEASSTEANSTEESSTDASSTEQDADALDGPNAAGPAATIPG